MVTACSVNGRQQSLLRRAVFINCDSKTRNYEIHKKVNANAGRKRRMRWPLPTTGSNIPSEYCQFGIVMCLKIAIKFAIILSQGIAVKILKGFYTLRISTFCKFLKDPGVGDDMLNMAN